MLLFIAVPVFAMPPLKVSRGYSEGYIESRRPPEKLSESQDFYAARTKIYPEDVLLGCICRRPLKFLESLLTFCDFLNGIFGDNCDILNGMAATF